MTVSSIITCLCLQRRNTTLIATATAKPANTLAKTSFLPLLFFAVSGTTTLAAFRFAINDFKDFIHRNYEPLFSLIKKTLNAFIYTLLFHEWFK